MVERWSWCRFQHFHGRRSRINQIKLRDLDGWPWKSRSNMCTGMTFVISGCKHDTDLILVSILAFFRSGISKKLKLISWPWPLTLKIKVRHTPTWPLLSLVVYMLQTWSWCWFQHSRGRGSQINQNESRDLDGWPWNSRSYTCTGMTFVISGCKHDTDLILVLILAY